MEAEPTTARTCQHCRTVFKTSAVHPSRYCSIDCEEGRAPLPESHPESPDYHRHLQANPEALVGASILAVGLKRTCYSPDWHRKPESYHPSAIVEVDEESEILIKKDEVYLGVVSDYKDGEYHIRYDDLDSGETVRLTFDESLVISQIRSEQWYVDA